MIEDLIRELFLEAWGKKPQLCHLYNPNPMGSTAKNFFEGFQNIYVGKLRSEDKFIATFLCIKALECLLIQKHHLVLSSTF